MSKGIFITATGTDIGKTYITALIVKLLRESSVNAGYYKAALSGAQRQGDSLVPGDCKFVCDVAKLNLNPCDLVSYVYETAVSPHLASEIEGNPVELESIIEDFQSIKSKFDYVVVEGSGGIVCPLRLKDKTIMLKDVITSLNLDIIIVASAELGTINNVVLTVEYAKNHNINVRGIILNNYDEKSFLHKNNKKVIENLTNIPVISCVGKGEKNIKIDIHKLRSLFKEV